ncbi:unnamed protein product [Linum tenue]|uniref:CCHC-type domain-containing protein n=1 Tax=Linum tenue TaxID=586396 RepID=A0AAV0IBL0_9ROSI|nr:unnamed protein product [Linum tenue]
MGRLIKVDRAMQDGPMGRFARVCVEVDLTKPLISQFKIEGVTYYIEHEGLLKICSECGRYGHAHATCPSIFKAAPTAVAATEHDGGGSQPSSKTYGEWMVAKSKSKQRNKKTPPSNSKAPVNVTNGDTESSRFAVLVEETDEMQEE